MMVMLSPCPSRPDPAGGVPWPSAVRSWLAAMLLAGIVFGQLGGHEMGLEETDRSRSKNGACGRITLSLRKDCDLIALRFSLDSTNHRSDAATVGSLCRIGEVEN